MQADRLSLINKKQTNLPKSKQTANDEEVAAPEPITSDFLVYMRKVCSHNQNLKTTGLQGDYI